MLLKRRSFLFGLVAAPAVIAIDRLMPVKLWTPSIANPAWSIDDLNAAAQLMWGHDIDVSNKEQIYTAASYIALQEATTGSVRVYENGWQ